SARHFRAGSWFMTSWVVDCLDENIIQAPGFIAKRLQTEPIEAQHQVGVGVVKRESQVINRITTPKSRYAVAQCVVFRGIRARRERVSWHPRIRLIVI